MNYYLNVEKETLFISEPEVSVLGGPDMFVETGSVINMTCSIAWTPAPPASTSWRHNNSLISFRGPRPGVSIIIDKGDITTAQLLIMSARSSDSGVYTCVPDNAPSTNVTLHVLTGDKTAELSHVSRVQAHVSLMLMVLV